MSAAAVSFYDACMRLIWHKCGRLPRWPLWAVALVAAWLALVGAAVVLSRVEGRPVELCLFKKATGQPCPTCGVTRGVLALADGRGLDAWLHNPLMFTLAAVAAALLCVRLASARRLALEATAAQRRWLLVAGLLLVAANWAYLLAFVH
jgi:hypothetical protein